MDNNSYRLKPAAACDRCRRRKIRCDGKRPVCSVCMRCRAPGECSYTPPSIRKKATKAAEQVTFPQMVQLEDIAFEKYHVVAEERAVQVKGILAPSLQARRPYLRKTQVEDFTRESARWDELWRASETRIDTKALLNQYVPASSYKPKHNPSRTSIIQHWRHVFGPSGYLDSLEKAGPSLLTLSDYATANTIEQLVSIISLDRALVQLSVATPGLFPIEVSSYGIKWFLQSKLEVFASSLKKEAENSLQESTSNLVRTISEFVLGSGFTIAIRVLAQYFPKSCSFDRYVRSLQELRIGKCYSERFSRNKYLQHLQQKGRRDVKKAVLKNGEWKPRDYYSSETNAEFVAVAAFIQNSTALHKLRASIAQRAIRTSYTGDDGLQKHKVLSGPSLVSDRSKLDEAVEKECVLEDVKERSRTSPIPLPSTIPPPPLPASAPAIVLPPLSALRTASDAVASRGMEDRRESMQEAKQLRRLEVETGPAIIVDMQGEHDVVQKDSISDIENLWNELDVLWRKQYGTRVPPMLRSLTIDGLSLLYDDPSTLSDYLKSWVEKYSGEPWNWWPINSPRKILMPGNVRLKWKCACGMDR